MANPYRAAAEEIVDMYLNRIGDDESPLPTDYEIESIIRKHLPEVSAVRHERDEMERDIIRCFTYLNNVSSVAEDGTDRPIWDRVRLLYERCEAVTAERDSLRQALIEALRPTAMEIEADALAKLKS